MTMIQKWVRFFREAGIEDESSATYADSFSTNRMDMTMLSDLNRDNLAFLGITILGDVIKVTKHAKIVAEKLNTDRILNDSPEVDDKPAAVVKAKKIKTKREVSPREEQESSPPQSSSQSRKRKLILKSEDIENSKSSFKSEPIAKVSAVSSRLGPAHSPSEDNDSNKSSVFKRLGETETSPTHVKVAKKTIFDRLDKVKQESDSIKVDLDKPSSRVVTTSGPNKIKDESRSTIIPNRGIKEEARSTIISTRVIKDEGMGSVVIQSRGVKEESRSAFQRLQAKPDSTQVPKVSSTNESFSMSADPKGILKQRKPAMFKSKSTSSIISLKSRESEERDAGKKRKIRVSFGSNEYRAVSPRKGIKTRLWGGDGEGDGGGGSSSGGEAESSEDEELKDVKFNKSLQAAQVDDLRMNIKRKQEAKQKEESTPEVQETKKTSGGDLRINISNSRVNLAVSTASVKQQIAVARNQTAVVRNQTAVVRNQTAVVRTQAAAIKQTASSVANKDVIPLKKVEKKIFVLRKMSDGTTRKVEIDQNDPRYQRYRTEVANAQVNHQKVGAVKQEIKQEQEMLIIKPERPSERGSTLNPSLKSRLSPAVIRPSATVTSRVSPVLPSRVPTVKPNLKELRDERMKKNDSYETDEDIREVRKIQYDVSDESCNESEGEDSWRENLKKPRLGTVAEKEDFMHKMRMHARQVQDQEIRHLQGVNKSGKSTEDIFESRQRSYANPSTAETQRAHVEKSQRTLGDRMRGFSPDIRDRLKKQTVNISFDDKSKSGTRFDEIERELLKKQHSISKLKTTIDQGTRILSRTTSEPGLRPPIYWSDDREQTDSNDRFKHDSNNRIKHDSNDRSGRHQSALVDSSRLGGVRRSLSSNEDDYRRDDNRHSKSASAKLRGGTMIADKEQSKPAIEDRLAVKNRNRSSHERSRSRSPQVIRQTNSSRSSRESSSRERDNGGSMSSRDERRGGGYEEYRSRNNSSKSSVKTRLG